MSYTALYRKFRPQNFSDVKGQDHIVTTLKNQLNADRIGHAYLFCGTRGTGKTTIAKIFARSVNCEHPVDGSPCGECPTCKAIAAGASMNVIEIDAASNNGVDNIREIREEVAYRPTEGKYKVYIIDEVHMLSIGAFNALLKTLEEPPEYVIFILATTEVHKIPVTILSRCQRYDFKRISVDTIADRLKELLDAEGVEAEEKAIKYIARSADGAMRDALSLLDQCIAFYLGQKLTYEKVLTVLGAVDTEVFSRLFKAVREQDAKTAIEILEETVTEGRELGQFTNDFAWYLRNLMLAAGDADVSEVLDMSAENLERLKEEAKSVDIETIIRYIHVFSELSNQLKYSSQKRILIEVALIRLCRPQMDQDYSSLIQRMDSLERKIASGNFAVKSNTDINESRTVAPAGNVGKAPVPEAIPEDIKQVISQWNAVLGQLKSKLLIMALKKAIPTLGAGNELMIVYEGEQNDSEYGTLSDSGNIKDLEETITQVIGKHVSVTFKMHNIDEPVAAESVYYNLLGADIHMDVEVDDNFDEEK